MHLAEGTLSLSVIIGGSGLAAVGCAWALAGLQPPHLVRAALLAALFFSLSFIHVPIAGTSVHLIGCALMGLLLGHRVWLAVISALGLQVMLLGYGGFTTLGTTACAMAIPALLSGWVLRHHGGQRGWQQTVIALICGWAAIQGALAIVAAALWLSQATAVAWMFIIAHQPVAIIEALITAAAVSYLRRAQPQWFSSCTTASHHPATAAVRP